MVSGDRDFPLTVPVPLTLNLARERRPERLGSRDIMPSSLLTLSVFLLGTSQRADYTIRPLAKLGLPP